MPLHLFRHAIWACHFTASLIPTNHKIIFHLLPLSLQSWFFWLTETPHPWIIIFNTVMNTMSCHNHDMVALILTYCTPSGGGWNGNVGGTISNSLLKMPSFVVTYNWCWAGLWHYFLLWHVPRCCCTAVSSFCCDCAFPLHCRLLRWLFLVNVCWLQQVTLHHWCLPTMRYTVAVLLVVVAAALVSGTSLKL
jgi:hypothetical protein